MEANHPFIEVLWPEPEPMASEDDVWMMNDLALI